MGRWGTHYAEHLHHFWQGSEGSQLPGEVTIRQQSGYIYSKKEPKTHRDSRRQKNSFMGKDKKIGWMEPTK